MRLEFIYRRLVLSSTNFGKRNNLKLVDSIVTVKTLVGGKYYSSPPPPPPPAGPGSNSVPYAEAPPESDTFFRLQINNSVRISLVEVYERRGKSDKRLLWGKKSHENFLLSWFFHIKKTLHLI